MLTLTQGSYTFDLSRFVTSYNLDIVPSFSWNELLNGSLSRKVDLGKPADKFYCDLELAIDFTSFIDFNSFYNNTITNGALTISTDLDLFFPNICSYSKVAIVDIADDGYLDGDIISRYKKVKIRLLLEESLSYAVVTDISSMINRSVWTPDYTYSTVVVLPPLNSAKAAYINRLHNDIDKWTVDFPLLKRSEAASLLSYILSSRTDPVTLTTNDFNSNASSTDYPVTIRQSVYFIESFELVNKKVGYEVKLTLKENAYR